MSVVTHLRASDMRARGADGFASVGGEEDEAISSAEEESRFARRVSDRFHASIDDDEDEDRTDDRTRMGASELSSRAGAPGGMDEDDERTRSSASELSSRAGAPGGMDEDEDRTRTGASELSSRADAHGGEASGPAATSHSGQPGVSSGEGAASSDDDAEDDEITWG